MNEEKTRKVLKGARAKILNGHIVLEAKSILKNATAILWICRAIADQFANSYPEVIVTPWDGGIINPGNVASRFSEKNGGKDIFPVYANQAEKGGFFIENIYTKYVAGKEALVIKDILFPNDNTASIIRAVQDAGGKIFGVGVICNWGHPCPERLGVKVEALIHGNI